MGRSWASGSDTTIDAWRALLASCRHCTTHTEFIVFKTKYGRFSQDGTEFIITTPKTPRPWVNVVSNGDAGFIVSQTGGGYSWRTNAQVNRLTRWEQDILKDEWGKYLYVKDRESDDFWSVGWKPVCVTPEHYEVRYGAGYVVMTSRTHGIETEWLMLVAPEEPVELWKVTVRNVSRRQRRLSMMSYFEWGLGAAPDWHREFHNCFIETRYDARANTILATKRLWEVPSENGHWNTPWPYVGFHSVNVKPSSFDCSKEHVLGRYGSVSCPHALRKGSLTNNCGNVLDAVASLLVTFSLKVGQEKTLVYTLGAAGDRRQARALVRKYSTGASVDIALQSIKGKWDRLLSTTAVETPDASLNLLANRWLKYQAIAGRLWGRTGYYQAGGAFGYRDQLQDSQIFLAIDPQQTRKQILLHARHQLDDGTVYHWWHPLSEVGHRTETTDDLLWLPFVVDAYLEETDDLSILEAVEPFVDNPASTTIQEHCIRAIDKVLGRMSSRKIPLIGAGDWNDGMSAVGLKWKGESVWLGQFLCFVLGKFAPILEARGDVERAEHYKNEARAIKNAVNTHGWDGQWYCYGTKDSGEKIGSQENTEGRVHLNPQTWAVISGVADHRRAHEVMNIVTRLLEHKAGPVLLSPAYRTPDEKIGYLTRYAPGVRENGAVYTHAATWAVIAAAQLGRAEDAYRLFAKINPVVRGKAPDAYYAEPYVTPGNIDGPESPFYGRGGWTWYTGSAAWLWKAAVEWILGVRASRSGLVVGPCIPKEWKGFYITRVFRDATYCIDVKNPHKVSMGIQTLVIDGKDAADFTPGINAVLPVFESGTSHQITIILGNQ